MVYLKSISAKLLSINVFVFLICSPLQAQSWESGWLLTLSDGPKITAISLNELNVDSLIINNGNMTEKIWIGSIDEVKHLRSATHAKKGARIGRVAGTIIGVPFGLFLGIVYSAIGCEGQGSSCSFGAPEFIGTVAVIGAAGMIAGAGVGAVIGYLIKKDKVYDMTGWSIEEKKAQIQQIMSGD